MPAEAFGEGTGLRDKVVFEVWRHGKLAHVEGHILERHVLGGDGHSIPNEGRDFTAKVLFGGSNPGVNCGMRFIAWGSSRAAFASAQTGLQGEWTGDPPNISRALSSYSHTAGMGSTTIKRTFRATGAAAVRECGVFSTRTPSTAGTMIARQILSTVQYLASADSIRAVWTFSH